MSASRWIAQLVLASASALVSGCHGAAASTNGGLPGGWTRLTVETGEARIETFRKGRGPTVLMHPSLGRPARDFADLGNRVAAAGYRVVVINPRGIGGSMGPMDGVTLHDLAADVWAVADQLGIERAFVLGQNFGNRVSRTASADRPERVLGLVLLAAGGEVEPDKKTWAEFELVFRDGVSPERHLEAVANSFFAPGNDPVVWKDGWNGKTAGLQVEAAKRTDFEKVYAGGDAPALVVQGLQDRIAPPINAWNFVNRRPAARLVAIPDMGHAMLPEQPEALAAAVIPFLDEHRPAAARQ